MKTTAVVKLVVVWTVEIMYNNRRIQEPVLTMMNSNSSYSSSYSNRKVIVVQEEPVEIEDIHVEDVAYCEGNNTPLEYNRIGGLINLFLLLLLGHVLLCFIGEEIS